MTPQTKRALRYGGRSLARVIGTIFKVVGTIILVLVTSGVLLTLIGALYVSKNLNTGLDINLYDFELKQPAPSITVTETAARSSWRRCRPRRTENWRPLRRSPRI